MFDEIVKIDSWRDKTTWWDDHAGEQIKLVGEAVEMKGQLSENLTEIEGKIKRNEESIRKMEGEFTQKIVQL